MTGVCVLERVRAECEHVAAEESRDEGAAEAVQKHEHRDRSTY